MHVLMVEKRNVLDISKERPQAPVHPGSETLRRAVRANIVSFPSQIPTLLKQPSADVQWRVVLLFFVRGWSASRIGARFNVPRHRIWKTLNGWSVRALALGYVQVIDPEAFGACCHLDVEESGTVRSVEETADIAARDGRPLFASKDLLPPVVMPAGNRPVDAPVTSVDVITALDAAIAHCETWREDFWVRTATLLRELRAVAATLELRRSNEQTEELFDGLPSGRSGLRPGMLVREEERLFHAVV
jgi:hypothetical protein